MPDSDLVIAAFTELAPEYEATVDRELREFWAVSYQDFLARLLAVAGIKADEDVLDVATGTAHLPLQITSRQAGSGRICGLDITPAMLVRGREKLEAGGHAGRTHLVCGSALAMPLADASFDAVVCALGTHHIETTGLVSEIHRVLRPGGRVVLADLCATRFWRSLSGKILLRLLLLGYGLSMRSARGQAEVEAFDNVQTVDEWRMLLTGCGFREVAFQEVQPRFPWYPGGLVASASRA